MSVGKMCYSLEKDLIEDFIKFLPETYTEGGKYVVFSECKTSWGIVDIMLVKYSTIKLEERKKKMPQISEPFTFAASYVLNRIFQCPYTTVNDLAASLKMSKSKIYKDISVLEERNLINKYKNGKLRAKSVAKSYFIENITAYEAKISNLKKALAQAERHLWFTNSSYVVLPELSNVTLEKVSNACLEKEIGLIVLNGAGKIETKTVHMSNKHFRTVLSWLINEKILDGGMLIGEFTV